MTLECVVNVSEGRDQSVLDRLSATLGSVLLDLHADPDHNRAVFTLGGDGLFDRLFDFAREVTELLDLRQHEGAHPRIGTLDVVPFVPIDAPLGPSMDLTEALEARARFAEFAANSLGLPCFLYGPERRLAEIRRSAFRELKPDLGPSLPNPRSGGVCVGARPPLVAYNVFLADHDLALARSIASSIRSEAIRALGFDLGDAVQVSCNLVAPWEVGPAECFDAIAARVDVASAELVGLVPASVLVAIPPARYEQLDLSPDRTIEARLRAV